MPSYVVTGASRGLGFQFLKTLAKDTSNTVFGLARDPVSLKSKLKDAELTTVHAIEGDVADAASMKRAALAVSKLTNGTIDVVINNAALVSPISAFKTLGDFDDDPATFEEEFTTSFRVNVLGLIHTASAFVPLLQAGTTKKFLNLSTGIADLDLINNFNFAYGTPYSTSKAAANLIVAKYNTVYGKGKENGGILFLSVSPGFVMTEQNVEAAQKDPEKAMAMGATFAAYAPNFERPATAEESVESVLKVLDEKSVEKGDGGRFVSHYGNQQWL